MKRLLTIQDLSTGFRLKGGKTKVLHQNISAEINSGEFIAILGPNGAGKSTLLKTLLGYIYPLTGEIIYGSKNIENISVKDMATIVSVVLTDKIDDIYITVEDVLMTARYPYNSFLENTTSNDKRIIEEVTSSTGITNLLHRRLNTLSDGERQKVMIARALAQDTPLIFLDEPTAFIDSPGRVELMQLLSDIPKKGKSVLMTIHDVELALHFTDTLWLLGKEGKFEKGDTETLINNKSINKLFDRGNIKFNIAKRRFE